MENKLLYILLRYCLLIYYYIYQWNIKCNFRLNLLIYYITNYLSYFIKDNEFIINMFDKELY